MHIRHKDDVREPERTEHGEVIYPLLGSAVDGAAEKHSLAYVVIPPGKSSLLHYHSQAEESYYILRGKGQLILENEEATVQPGQTILIRPRQRHKIINDSSDDLEFLVVSAPPWRAADMVVSDERGQ